MNCHAPLAEQKQQFMTSVRSGVAARDPVISSGAGNSCAACHARGHRVYGPPAASDHSSVGAHGGVIRSEAFEQSEFCAACHQFPAEAAINGKPLENTYAEWRASRFSADGQTCQSCHMPGRRHLFRGIHDPAMVAGGLTVNVSASAGAARFSVTSSAIGHAFPTYVTPKIVIRAIALDQDGHELPATGAEQVISRVVESGEHGWVESSDTRLMPGQTASIDVPWNGHRTVRFWVEVYPDDYYRREVYPELERDTKPGSAAAMNVKQASQDANHSGYRLFDQTVTRPPR